MTDVKAFLEEVASQALATKAFGSTCAPQIEVTAESGAALFPLRDQAAIEVTLEAEHKRLRVGFATKDRGFNDQVEDQLLASGESFGELLETELEEFNAESAQYAVDHYFDRDARAFRFSTYVPYDADSLVQESFRKQTALLAAAFRGVVRELVEFYGH